MSVACECQSSYDAFVFILTESLNMQVSLVNSDSRPILFSSDLKGLKKQRNRVLSGTLSDSVD